MKNSILAILLFFTFYNIDAQKIKISDGNVLLDKVPIAKIEGKSGIFTKTDLLFSSLQEKPLIRVKERRYDYFLENYTDLFWYEVELVKSGEKIACSANAQYSQKQLADWLFIRVDPKLLKDNEIDTLAWNALKDKNDLSSKIQSDTTTYLEFETALIDKLKNYKYSGRNLGAAISLSLLTSSTFATSTVSSYKIFQDGIQIGFVEKSFDKSNMGIEGHFSVYKLFAPVLEVQGKTYDRGLVAYIKTSTIPTIQITQLKKNKRVDFPIGENSEITIVKYLIDNGFL